MMMMVSEQTKASASLAGKTTTDVVSQSTNSLVVDGLKEITRGLLTVLKQHNTDPITLEYPEVMPDLSDRFHGRLSLLSKSDGTDLCIGCQACARDYSREALVLDKKDLTLNGEESDQWRKKHGLAVTVA